MCIRMLPLGIRSARIIWLTAFCGINVQVHSFDQMADIPSFLTMVSDLKLVNYKESYGHFNGEMYFQISETIGGALIRRLLLGIYQAEYGI